MVESNVRLCGQVNPAEQVGAQLEWGWLGWRPPLLFCALVSTSHFQHNSLEAQMEYYRLIYRYLNDSSGCKNYMHIPAMKIQAIGNILKINI